MKSTMVPFKYSIISEACMYAFSILGVLDMNKQAMKTNKQTMKTNKQTMKTNKQTMKTEKSKTS